MILNAIIYLFILFILTDSYYLRKVNHGIDKDKDDDFIKTKVHQTEAGKKRCYNYSIENFQSNTTNEEPLPTKEESVPEKKADIELKNLRGPIQKPSILSENDEESIIFNYLKPKIIFLLDQNLTNNIHISAHDKKYLVSIEKDNLSVLAYITDM